MCDWERRLLLALLWPVLWVQSRYVRHVTSRMLEALDARSGSCGQGASFRVLLAGDSGAAGVGVTTQDQALCARILSKQVR